MLNELDNSPTGLGFCFGTHVIKLAQDILNSEIFAGFARPRYAVERDFAQYDTQVVQATSNAVATISAS